MSRPVTYPKSAKCQHCTEEFMQRDARNRYCSVSCSAAAAADVARELHNHSGPAYDRWKDAYIKSALRLAGEG